MKRNHEEEHTPEITEDKLPRALADLHLDLITLANKKEQIPDKYYQWVALFSILTGRRLTVPELSKKPIGMIQNKVTKAKYEKEFNEDEIAQAKKRIQVTTCKPQERTQVTICEPRLKFFSPIILIINGDKNPEIYPNCIQSNKY